jgi:hypothetical protein
MKKLFSLAIMFFCFGFVDAAQASEPLVFVINTKEHDIRGAVTAPYLDEAADIEAWQKIFPQARVVRIRANSTTELRKVLELYMQDPTETYEVLGLFIRSHGERMRLFNESESFHLSLATDLPTVFQPVIGHFAPGTRVVFDGCSVLEGMNSDEAAQALQGILHDLGITNGGIYANRTLGYEGLEGFSRTSITNGDIPWNQRATAALFYGAFPITVPIAYLMRVGLNRGYFLEVNGESTKLYKTNYFKALKPELSK